MDADEPSTAGESTRGLARRAGGAGESAAATHPGRTHHGRIAQWPRSADDRLELLNWITDRLRGTDEVLAEKPFTQKLFDFTIDPNTLRRALVDAGLITRNDHGTDYHRAPV